MKLTIHTRSGSTEAEFSPGDNLLAVLRRSGANVAADCGGRGTCGKCKVKVISGLAADADEYVLACRTKLSADAAVSLPERDGSGLLAFDPSFNVTGRAMESAAALDIGTTTLACYLVDAANGTVGRSAGALNPQRSFGADVISRIQAASEGALPELHRLIVQATDTLLDRLTGDSSGVQKLFVTGNTTMLHLFLNVSPESMGVYPYTPTFTQTVTVPGHTLGVRAQSVTVLPSVSAFVGSDVVCGGVAVDILSGNNLLVDLGTNGEMLLCADGKLYGTSTAAGPALEGAEITCGMGGVDGAVNSVTVTDGRVQYTVLGDTQARGLCGSGLIDAVAAMLDEGVIDETGAFVEGDRFTITDDVFVTVQDVRKFQLAKSAIAAGIGILCRRAGIGLDEIDAMYVAGGLGFYVRPESAVRVGLIPGQLAGKMKVVGNAAGKGAVQCLLDERAERYAERIARDAVIVDLSQDADFMNEYMTNMFFEQ